MIQFPYDICTNIDYYDNILLCKDYRMRIRYSFIFVAFFHSCYQNALYANLSCTSVDKVLIAGANFLLISIFDPLLHVNN